MPAGTWPVFLGVARHISVFVSGKDVTPWVMQDSSFSVEDCTASGSLGTFSCNLNRKLSLLPELSASDFVRVIDHDANKDLFRGFLTDWEPTQDENHWDHIEIRAQDHGILLDNYFAGPFKRPAESAKARIGFFWGITTPWYLDQSLSLVTVSTVVPAATYQGFTLRRLLDEIAADVSTTCRWYLDQGGRLHFYETESNPAPFDITGLGDTPGAGEIGPHNLRIHWDAGDYANRVYIKGGNAAGSGYVLDMAAIKKANVIITTNLDYPNSKDATRRNAVGLRHLSWLTQGMMRGSFTAFSPDDGWLAGQVLNVRASSMAINGAARIVKVRTTLLSPTKRRYDVEFGATRRGFAKRFRR